MPASPNQRWIAKIVPFKYHHQVLHGMIDKMAKIPLFNHNHQVLLGWVLFPFFGQRQEGTPSVLPVG